MSLRVALGILALLGFAICVVWLLLVMGEIETAVDGALKEELQPDGFGPRGKRAARYMREYRRLFPEGTLTRKLNLLQAGLFACGLIALFVIARFR